MDGLMPSPDFRDLMDCIRFFLSNSWKFFTQVDIPGLGVSFAALFVGLFLAVMGLRLLSYMFGFGHIDADDFRLSRGRDKDKKGGKTK